MSGVEAFKAGISNGKSASVYKLFSFTATTARVPLYRRKDTVAECGDSADPVLQQMAAGGRRIF